MLLLTAPHWGISRQVPPSSPRALRRLHHQGRISLGNPLDSVPCTQSSRNPFILPAALH